MSQHQKTQYTQISNDLIKYKPLSLQAKGLQCIISMNASLKQTQTLEDLSKEYNISLKELKQISEELNEHHFFAMY